jgi:queuine tRNA-ribosyltransferase
VRENELLGLRMLSLHNVHFVTELCHRAREEILAGHFAEWAEEWILRYGGRQC